MMKPAFDLMLERFGRTITIRRETPAPVVSVDVKAKVRVVKADEITGGVQQNDMMVVSQVPEGAWTGMVKKGHRVIVGTKIYTVEFCYPVYEGEELVGYRMVVRG